MDTDSIRERIEEIDKELSDLYNVDFSETGEEEIRRRAEKSERLEDERRRLQGYLNVNASE
jgi:hypothetical protein